MEIKIYTQLEPRETKARESRMVVAESEEDSKIVGKTRSDVIYNEDKRSGVGNANEVNKWTLLPFTQYEFLQLIPCLKVTELTV